MFPTDFHDNQMTWVLNFQTPIIFFIPVENRLFHDDKIGQAERMDTKEQSFLLVKNM